MMNSSGTRAARLAEQIRLSLHGFRRRLPRKLADGMDAPSENRHQGGGKETGTSGLRASESNRSPRTSLPAQLQQLSDTAHRPAKRGLLGIPSGSLLRVLSRTSAYSR